MTTESIHYEQRLARIHQTGYWRIIIHPNVFKEERISSLQECWEMMITSTVNFRGLPYPTVRNDERVQGNDWVQSGGEFGDGTEVWRFYQSGQFVHTFSMSEDVLPLWRDKNGVVSTDADITARQLNIYNTLFTLTEILEFARKLAHRDVLDPAAKIRVELHGSKGRCLVAPNTPGFGSYVSADEVVTWETRVLPLDLIVAAPRHAIDAAIYVFERFNWRSPPRRMLEERQRRLLDRRPY